jgi:hypothetical protein
MALYAGLSRERLFALTLIAICSFANPQIAMAEARRPQVFEKSAPVLQKL